MINEFMTNCPDPLGSWRFLLVHIWSFLGSPLLISGYIAPRVLCYPTDWSNKLIMCSSGRNFSFVSILDDNHQHSGGKESPVLERRRWGYDMYWGSVFWEFARQARTIDEAHKCICKPKKMVSWEIREDRFFISWMPSSAEVGNTSPIQALSGTLLRV